MCWISSYHKLLGGKEKNQNPTSHPLLHRAFAVQYVAGCSFPFELEHSVNQDKEAQGQDAGNDDGYGFHSAGCVVQFDDNVNVILGAVPVFISICWSITTHKILEDGSGIAGFHPEHLVIEFPVLFSFVEICEAWGRKLQLFMVILDEIMSSTHHDRNYWYQIIL